MIPKTTLLRGLYFDIETAGIYESFGVLTGNDPKLASLWSKRCKWLRLNSGPELMDASDSTLWKEKATLHPEFGKVICVTIGAYNKEDLNIINIVGDEKEILTKVNTIFNNAYSKNLILAGQSIRMFDIPFLGKRMVIHGIRPSEAINFFNKKPWDISIMELNEIFSFGASGQSHTSLDLICTVLGVDSPKDAMDGSMVHSEFYKGNIDGIQKYCEKDVRSMIGCFNKLSF